MEQNLNQNVAPVECVCAVSQRMRQEAVRVIHMQQGSAGYTGHWPLTSAWTWAVKEFQRLLTQNMNHEEGQLLIWITGTDLVQVLAALMRLSWYNAAVMQATDGLPRSPLRQVATIRLLCSNSELKSQIFASGINGDQRQSVNQWCQENAACPRRVETQGFKL